ncbi:uncharacterized protein LOC123346147 isoform X2 [Mauremys mutica]|uniref:Uncharacterized protein n=1 Tax=Mauremys mutica TaxID=74926 RepID=A0A9D3XPE8_9SAUR|nr:uncharacterized protein LOC123346147 isoform X2 [Mauremys mutica]KAH1183156.1 hypothetical protein KIL84_004648 [Mauremys mutica]
MVGVFLLWVFVGRCSPLSLAVPAAPVAVVPGGTALLPAALRLPAPPPPFFQVRWRFLATGRLVLLLAAQDCSGAAPWRRSCRLALEHGRGYESRAGLGPREAALLLRDAGPEDAGTYRVSLLGLDVTASAEVNLTLAPAPAPTPGPAADPTIVLPPTAPAPANSTEPQGLRFPASPPGALHPGSLLRPLLRDTEPPLAPVWATLDGGGAVVSNAVRLGLAGLVLCLLALITGEYVLSIRNKDTPGTDSPPDAAATITTLSTIYVLQEMPIPDASEELYASLSF